MNFEINQKVKWSSQAQGYTKEKQGTIEMVVPANTRAQHPELKGHGFRRPGESYLVRVPGKTQKSKGVVYWPHASKLQLVEPSNAK